MLASANRLRRSSDFATVIRSGARARRGHLVLHLRPDADTNAGSAAPRVGLVVGRTVGASVVRHRVSRRLRHQMGARLSRLPAGSTAVIRALPGAAEDSSARFGADLDAALDRLVGAR